MLINLQKFVIRKKCLLFNVFLKQVCSFPVKILSKSFSQLYHFMVLEVFMCTVYSSVADYRLPLPPTWVLGGSQLAGGVGGWGDPIPTKGQKLCYSVSTIIPLRF